MKPINSLYCALAITLGLTGIASANQFVKVTGNNVDIRIAASSSATVIGQADAGMVFRYISSTDGWHEVGLASGEYRYFQSSMGDVVDTNFELTNSKDVLVQACEEYAAAEKRASKEAEELEPDFLKQIDLERLLVDKYKLGVFIKFDIAPALSTELTVWCVENRY